jgi:hypothetical protein
MSFLSKPGLLHTFQAVVCTVLLVCIVIIVIAPEVDIPPTTLRAPLITATLLIQLALFALIFGRRFEARPSLSEFVFSFVRVFHPSTSRLSTFHVLLC